MAGIGGEWLVGRVRSRESDRGCWNGGEEACFGAYTLSDASVVVNTAEADTTTYRQRAGQSKTTRGFGCNLYRWCAFPFFLYFCCSG